VVEWYNLISEIDNEAHFRLIVVNDGSDNISKEEVEYLKQEVPGIQYIDNTQNFGKGYAIRTGAQQSKNDYLIFTDIDFPYTFESLKSVVKALKNGTDVALGYRDETYYDNVPLIRKIISVTFRGFLRYILRWPVTDSQCGIKGFSEKGKEVLLSTEVNRYLFDVELIQRCKGQRSLVITAVNVYLREGIEFSTIKPIILLKEIINLLRIFSPFRGK